MKKELIEAIKAAESTMDRLHEAQAIAKDWDKQAALCIGLIIERQTAALTLLRQVEQATGWD